MRTTLTLDDDLAGLLKQRAREMGIPFRTRSTDYRAGSARCRKPTAARRQTVPHSFGFRPGIDIDKLGQLADELEAEAFTAPPIVHMILPDVTRSRTRAHNSDSAVHE